MSRDTTSLSTCSHYVAGLDRTIVLPVAGDLGYATAQRFLQRLAPLRESPWNISPASLVH